MGTGYRSRGTKYGVIDPKLARAFSAVVNMLGRKSYVKNKAVKKKAFGKMRSAASKQRALRRGAYMTGKFKGPLRRSDWRR